MLSKALPIIGYTFSILPAICGFQPIFDYLVRIKVLLNQYVFHRWSQIVHGRSQVDKGGGITVPSLIILQPEPVLTCSEMHYYIAKWSLSPHRRFSLFCHQCVVQINSLLSVANCSEHHHQVLRALGTHKTHSIIFLPNRSAFADKVNGCPMSCLLIGSDIIFRMKY